MLKLLYKLRAPHIRYLLEGEYGIKSAVSKTSGNFSKSNFLAYVVNHHMCSAPYNDSADTYSDVNVCEQSEVNDSQRDTFKNDSAIDYPIKIERNPFYEIENDFKIATESDDVIHFIDTIGPPPPVSFNLAAYADRSPTLQKLIQLGVDLSKIEPSPEKSKLIMSLDFETDMKSYIQFLHDKGVPDDKLGKFLSRNPLIFKEDLEDMQTRINYLLSKKFTHANISRIITENPYHLSLDTKTVDRRLGLFQKTFEMTGDEIRFLVTKYPKLVSYNYNDLMEKIFVLKEEMAFSMNEMKQLLLMKPKIFMLGRKNLTHRFDVVHNLMGISHEDILRYPGILLKRGFLLEQRHKYLQKLGKAQYDPSKPGYISLIDMATTTDNAFCKRCAKTSVAEFNEFLKTM